MSKTATQKALEIYENDPRASVCTKPYYSRRCFEFEVVNANLTYGFAFAKAVKGETIFFDYGYGSGIISRGANDRYKPTKADTNVSKAKSTNGAAHMVIKRIGFKPTTVLALFPNMTVDAASFFGATDAEVVAALKGEHPVYDPQSLVVPAIGSSPYLSCASALFEGLSQETSVNVKFDGQDDHFLPPLHEIGQAGASSFARAHGTPDGDGAFTLDEELLWCPDGQEDSDLEVECKVHTDIVIPFTLPKHLLSNSAAWVVAPTKLWVEVQCTLEGDEYRRISNNA